MVQTFPAAIKTLFKVLYQLGDRTQHAKLSQLHLTCMLGSNHKPASIEFFIFIPDDLKTPQQPSYISRRLL